MGILILLVELICLAGFVVMMIHPEVLQDKVLVLPDPELSLSPESNDSFLAYDWIHPRQSTSEDRFFGFLLLSGMVTISTMLIYGAVMGRPGYLMPFFCIQVFHFCMTCLSGVGYFSYIPDIKRWIEAQPGLPYKEELLEMNSDWLVLVCVLSFAFTLLVEAYLIGMVWACYKYLVQYERNLTQGTLPIRTFNPEHTEDTEMLLPPKYEDAVRMAAEEPPPPPYAN